MSSKRSAEAVSWQDIVMIVYGQLILKSKSEVSSGTNSAEIKYIDL